MHYKNFFESLTTFETVGRHFKITRGADTGNNAAFLITKEEWLNLPKGEKAFFRPCIMRDSIKDGRLNDNLYLFYPYNSRKISSEEDLINKLPNYLERRLMRHSSSLKKRNGFENKWWELSRPRSFHNQPKLVSAYFGKAGYFAYDETGEYVVGQSFAWLPVDTNLNDKRYSFAYLALLHSEFINNLLQMVCNVLDGGYFDLSKHYIDKMPIPNLSKADFEIVTELEKIGKSIHCGEKYEKKRLNIIVANTYGLNWEDYQDSLLYAQAT